MTIAKGGHKLKPFTNYRLSLGNKGPNLTLDTADSLDGFLRLLSLDFLDRPIINKTELTGLFDFHLEFAAPEHAVQGLLPTIAPTAENPPGASIFTALQEQLGLKLDAGKGPIETIIISQVEKPIPD